MQPDGILRLGAVVLAAGLSSRMGKQKMLLPWAGKTVIETVVDTLIRAEVEQIVVVIGRDAEQIREVLKTGPAQAIYNPLYTNGNMVTSFLTGIGALSEKVDAVLLALGDQPQMQMETILTVVNEWMKNPEKLCIPSFQMRRGHPWIIPSKLWHSLSELKDGKTMRDFIRMHESNIQYVLVEKDTILADLDTPEDYATQNPD
jgi:molybdenum cofactor cytidylyltransferase